MAEEGRRGKRQGWLGMRLKELHVNKFRSIDSLALMFDANLTTLVGENGTGKTTTGIAIQTLFQNVRSGLGSGIQQADYPYGESAPLAINALIEFSEKEIEQYLIANLIPSDFEGAARESVVAWLRKHGRDISINLGHETGYRVAELSWGGLHILANLISAHTPTIGSGGRSWTEICKDVVEGKISASEWHSDIQTSQFTLENPPNHEVATRMGELL